jgi:ABC-type branched-subunit amino acid transport system ATPase component
MFLIIEASSLILLFVKTFLSQKEVMGKKKWTVEKIYNLFPVLRSLDDRVGGNLAGGTTDANHQPNPYG